MTEYKPKYEQKISSYKIVFYDMDNNVVDIPERAMSCLLYTSDAADE